jgi:hypothetical protein
MKSLIYALTACFFLVCCNNSGSSTSDKDTTYIEDRGTDTTRERQDTASYERMPNNADTPR